MAHTRHLRDGNNAVNIPDGVSLRLGSYGTLPTCNAGRENHIAVSGGVIYLCDGSAWAAVGTSTVAGAISVTDGITAPTAATGKAFIYVDTADGDLKVRFADGITKTLATDT